MDNALHYKKYGSGPEPLVLFHGFGQDHRAFEPLIPMLEKTYTIYAFDLYYHGKSYRENRRLSKQDWLKDFDRFLKREKVGAFSVIAFSLGGRFAITTAMGFPQKVKKMILIAPDGIYKNFWYLFATSPVGNRLFKYLMLRPTRFEKWLAVFDRWKLASPSMIRFARKELQDRENCLRVYQSWTYFRPLQHAVPDIIRFFNREQTVIHLFLGEKDYIIPVKKVRPKLAGIKSLFTHILPLKHHHLIEGAKDSIVSVLSQEKKR